jgi:iron complex transport system substrate-binding protein
VRARGLALWVALVLAGTAHAAPALRVVSLNLCTDQLVLALVEPAAIAALSLLARDPRMSPVALGAASLPSVLPRAESVLPLRPDVVLVGSDSASFTTDALRRAGVAVTVVPDAESIDALRANLRAVGVAVGEPARAEAAVARVDQWLAVLDQRRAALDRTLTGRDRAPAASDARVSSERPPRALVLAAGGWVAGPGTLADALIARAGFVNAATEAGFGAFGRMTLEQILAAAPDALIVDADAQGGASQARAWLAHPALARSRVRSVAIPGRLWSCGTPLALEAVSRLLDARELWAESR